MRHVPWILFSNKIDFSKASVLLATWCIIESIRVNSLEPRVRLVFKLGGTKRYKLNNKNVGFVRNPCRVRYI